MQVKAIAKNERFLIMHHEKEAFQLYFKKTFLNKQEVIKIQVHILSMIFFIIILPYKMHIKI